MTSAAAIPILPEFVTIATQHNAVTMRGRRGFGPGPAQWELANRVRSGRKQR